MLAVMTVMPCFWLEGGKWTINWESVWFAKQEAWSSALSQSQCPWDYNSVTYYLNWDVDGDWVVDMGKQWYLVDNARYYWNENSDYRAAWQTVKNSTYQGSSVRYYVPEDHMLKIYDGWVKKSLSDTSAWYRASSIFPINQWTRALSSQPFLISIPNNRSNNTIQIAYKIRYAVFRWYNSWKTSSYVAMPVSWRRDNSWITSSGLWWLKADVSEWDWGGPIWKSDYVNQASSVTTKSIKWSETEYEHDYECMNIQVAWCGDGIVQNWTYDNGVSASEKCDPNDPNQTNWWTDGCTAACQPKDKPQPDITPECNPAYTGSHYNDNYPIALLNNDMKLCLSWDHNDSLVWPVEPGRTYTWKCNWSAWKTPAECSAKELWCWDGKLQEDKEQCDPNDPNQTNWNGKVCNSSCQLVDKKVYDLALTKKLNNESKTKYKLWENVVYKITVYNQGNFTAKNIEITEYIPTWLSLDDSNWTLSSDGAKATRVITDEIAPWVSKSVTLTMKIDSNFTGKKILNKAEISKDNSDDYGEKDIDSDPDNNPDNDCLYGEDNHIITGNGKGYTEEKKACDETTDEDDHDVVPIYIEEEPGEPTIDKNLLGDREHKYNTGELVGFKMVFKNPTEKTVTHAKIKDFLPLNLEYVSSEIHWVSPILSGLYLAANGQTVLEYSGFDLAPGQEGYLIMTGKVLSSHLKNRLNTVCVYGNDKTNSQGDDEAYQCDSDFYKMWGIQIEKSVDKTSVISWDIVEYTITVTSTDGSYTGFTIVDTLPKGLAFISDLYPNLSTPYSISVASWKNPTVSFSTGKDESNLDIQTWDVAFPNWVTFDEGDVLTIKFKARVTETILTKYTNVACIFPPEEPVQCDKEDVVTNIQLHIKKYVSDSLTGTWHDDSMVLENGKTAYFKIVVSWADEPMQSFRVKDRLDNSKLSFLSGSWNLENNAFTGVITFDAGNTTSHEYSIKPVVDSSSSTHTQLSWLVDMKEGKFMSWDKLEIIFMVEKKADETNTAYVCYDKEDKEVCDDDPAKVTSEDVKLGITKKVSTAEAVDGDWRDTWELANDSIVYFKLIIAWASEPMQTFRVKDTLNDSKLLFQSDKSYAVKDNYFTGVIAFWTNNKWDQKSYSIVPSVSTWNGTHILTWKVDMGSGYFVKGDTLTIIFATQKKDAETNTAYVCYDKDWKEVDPCPNDNAKVTTPGWGNPWGGWWGWGGGWTPYCWDGKKWGIEMCDLGWSKIVGSDGKLFNNGDVYEKEYAWWTCTSSCTLKNESWEAPACFNVQNGSISIMKGELLPFFWNMEGAIGKMSSADRSKYLTDNFVTKCSDKNSDGHISLETMMCNFRIYGPNRTEKKWVMDNIVYEFNAPCVGTNAWWNPTYPSIAKFIEQNKNWWFKWSQLYSEGEGVKNVFATLDDGWHTYPTLAPISSKVLIKKFWEWASSSVDGSKTVITKKAIDLYGEYKISLQSVTYDICSDGKDWSSITVNDRVCEVDFAVTNPYMVQKSTYGSNALNTPLKYYKTKNGFTLFDITKEVNPSDYSVPKSLATTFDKFVSKYSKQAKSTGISGLTKVSWKSIYFTNKKDIYIDGNWDNGSLIKMTNVPFTLVATDPNAVIRIRGNLYSNAMIMTKGKIVFDAQGACNGNKDSSGKVSYGHAWQMVKWIFYAGQGFESKNDMKNINVSNSDWCNYWNLHIKGVAIWDLTKVVNERRSELYTWFREKSDTPEAKRDVVLNWASVLVEYSPDLWWSLPPGAEEFNTALEVYRK